MAKMNPEDMSRPALSHTLGEAVHALIYLVECTKCKHRSRVDLAALEGLYGPDFPVERIRSMLQCSKCGRKQTIITTLWRSATTTDAMMQRWTRETGG